VEFTEACCKALCSFAVSATICFVFLFCCRLVSSLFFHAFQEFLALLSCFIASSPHFLSLRVSFYCNFPTFSILVTLCNLIWALASAVIFVISSPVLSNCPCPQLCQRELRHCSIPICRAPGTVHARLDCAHKHPNSTNLINFIINTIKR
jgi:hypothetical protein